MNTFNAQMGLLKDRVVDAGISVGSKLLPMLTNAAKGIGAWMEKNGDLIDSIGDLVVKGFEKIAAFGKFLSGEFQGQMDRGLTPMQAAIRTAQTVGEKLLNLVPKGVTQNLSGLGSALLILGGPMMLLAREILPRIAPAFKAIIPPLADLVNKLAPVFADFIVTLVDNLLPGLLVMLDGLIGFLAGNGGLVKALGMAMLAFKALTLVMAVNPFILIATAVIAIAALIITNWDTIKGYLTRTWEAIQRGASVIWGNIKGFFSSAVEFIKNLFLNFTPLGLFIKHMDTIKEVAAGAANWVRDRFNALVDFFKGFGPAVGRAVGGVANLITSPFKAAFNAIAKLWNNTVGKLKFEIPGWVPGIGGNKFNVPQIPTFHEGGVFRAPPGQREGLAVLEDGETVTPAGGGGVTEHHWHISQPMDAMAVFDFAAWRMRTAGV
jgi:phage-related protein